MAKAAELPVDRQPAELTDFSPSRLGVASKCGLAFRYQYIDKLPAPYETGAQLFGNAVHYGVQKWYDLDNEGWKEEPLAPVICAQWEGLLPPEIWKHVKELIDLDEECAAVAAAILFKRPELKNPSGTKAYMESQAAKDFSEKKVAMVGLCDALPNVKWPKDEDPYKAYCKAAAIGDMLQARWRGKPRPLVVEVPFRIEYDGFWLRGRIDQIRVDPDPKTGEVAPNVTDLKTGRNLMTQMEAFIQAFIYSEATLQLDGIPDCDEVEFLMCRHNKRQGGKIARKRHRKLASRILNGRARQITMGQFEPSYGFWCSRCDFQDLCEKEIGMWKDDGIVLEAVTA